MQDVLQKVLLWTPGSVFNPLTVRCNKFLHVIPVEQLSGCVYPRTDGGGGKKIQAPELQESIACDSSCA